MGEMRIEDAWSKMSKRKRASYVKIEEKDGELYLEGDVEAGERILRMLKQKPEVKVSRELDEGIREEFKVDEVELKPPFFRILWRKKKGRS